MLRWVYSHELAVGVGRMTQEQLWQAALGQLELRVSQGNFLTWFRDAQIREYREGIVVIDTPSSFAYEWLSRKYRTTILDVLKGLDISVQDVQFTIRSQSKIFRPAKRNNHIVAQKQRREQEEKEEIVVVDSPPLNTGKAITLNPKYTFETYVTGPNNEVAYAACRAVSGKPGTAYNPLFIYGGVGLGKTHLMHAIGNAILHDLPLARVLYVSSEKFINEFVQSIQDRKTQEFKQRYREVDVLMIDDVQFMAGKGKTQEELFHTFNSLYGQNKQIILSSDRSPKLIPTFEERLRSRLAGGMMVDIQQPDYETRLAILTGKAITSPVRVDPESLAFIAKNIQKNVRELEGALNRVIAYCELNQKPATLEYTQKVLTEILDRKEQRTIDSRKIIEAVSGYYNLSYDELCGKCRKKEIVQPRQVAMYLLRKENNASFPAIGHQFGGRDHTTAMHACEKIEKLLEHNQDLLQDITFIRERLYA